MATINKGQNFINVTAITADVDHVDIFKDYQPKKIKRIEFYGGSTGDKCVVKYDSASGPVITTLGVSTSNIIDRCFFDDGGEFMKIFIDFSECTLSAGHLLVIELS